jgi:hypothetical protein
MRNTRTEQVAEVNSPDFARGTTQLSSSVDSYKRQSDIANDTALILKPKAAGCFREMFRSQLGDKLPTGARAQRVTVHIARHTRDEPRNVVGNISGSVLVAGGGRRIEVSFVEAAITGPSIEASVTGVSIGHPVPAALMHRLAAAVAHRAADPKL